MGKLLGADKVIVGIDISDSYSQISYACQGKDQVETISMVAGETYYNIPTVLCKRTGVNQWSYGKEALRMAQEEQGILVRDLLSLALDGEPVQIEGQPYDPAALLALFLKRCLGMLSRISSPERIEALMITCKELDSRILEVLSQAVTGMRLKTDRIFFQNHTESFYYYMLHQPEELWRFQTLLLEYRDSRIYSYRMECNKKTVPVAVFIQEDSHPFLSCGPVPEQESLREEKWRRLDSELLELAQQLCQNQMISSVYLIGEQFHEDWMKESLKYLCRGKRVFQGNNLYSKGACLGVQEKLNAGEAAKNHVFLGSDKLKTNVGMKILRRGQDSYYAVLDAGLNWYEARQDLEFYVQEGCAIELVLTSLTGKGSRLALVTMEDFPGGISRLRGSFYMKREDCLAVELEDLGFGSIRQATHRVWKEEIKL